MGHCILQFTLCSPILHGVLKKQPFLFCDVNLLTSSLYFVVHDKRLGTHAIFEGLRERTEYVPHL